MGILPRTFQHKFLAADQRAIPNLHHHGHGVICLAGDRHDILIGHDVDIDTLLDHRASNSINLIPALLGFFKPKFI